MTPLQKFMEFMRENHYWIGNELVDKYWQLITDEKEMIDKAYSDGVQDAVSKIASDSQPTGYYQKKFTK
jgi:hypothetical protein